MPMVKIAQHKSEEYELEVSAPDDTEKVALYEDMPEPEEVLQVHAPKEEVQITFKLPLLPGSTEENLEVFEDDSIKDKESSPEVSLPKAVKDFWNWQECPKKDFLTVWYKQFLDRLPKHKGELAAVERTIAYLKRGLDIISKAMQQDFDGEIDASRAEEARVETSSAIKRLEKYRDSVMDKEKKASIAQGLTKEAQKAPAVGGIIVTVPLLVSAIARTCINSSISGGKDIEDTFAKLAKKFDLSDREKVEVVQLLMDMNMPIRRDLFLIDDEESYQYSGEGNFNYPPNYKA